jgi:hypothetical protein
MDFYEGLFRVDQARKDALLKLSLAEKLACPGAARSSAKAKQGPAKRHLWGSGKGNARTEGKYGSALVRGTTWGTFDTCRSTTVKVKDGVVTAFDKVKGTQKQVPAGRQYVARAK